MSTREDLPRIARLAGLRFTDAELVRLAEELDDILDRVAELDPFADTAVPPFRHEGDADATLREDVPGPDELQTPPSYIAPDWRAGFFTVPRLPTHSERE